MAITIGNSSVRDICLGNSKVDSVFLGDVMVYGNFMNDPEDTYNQFVFDTSKMSIASVILSPQRGGDTTQWNGYTDWGDGIINKKLSHQYADIGIYTVKTKYVLNEVYDNNEAFGWGSKNALIKCLGVNKNITDASYLFWACENLESVDLSNIINYGYLSRLDNMFLHCKSLKSIDLSGIDTHNVTDMNGMFCFCESLTELDLSSFDTSNVTNMEYMFSVCPSLTKLNISNFNMDNVTKYSYMFNRCDNLTLDNIIMTNCNEATKAKITEAFNNKNTTQ